MTRIIQALIAALVALGIMSPAAAHATPVATSNPAPIIAGSPVTVTANLGSPGVNFIVVPPAAFGSVTWGANCRVGYQTTRPPVTDIVCHDTFTFTVAAAPVKPSAPQSYPLNAGYWYGLSRGKPSYSRPVPYVYLDSLYG